MDSSKEFGEARKFRMRSMRGIDRDHARAGLSHRKRVPQCWRNIHLVARQLIL